MDFHYFLEPQESTFWAGLVQLFCDVTDGPCKYTGDNMVDIHTGMNVTEGDFNHLVDLLINSMDEQGIPHLTQNKLLARLTPLRGEVIYQ